MSKPKPTDMHRQCKLVQGNRVIFTWLPAKYAVVGKGLSLKDEDGNWTTGWRVDEVWALDKSSDVLAREDLWRHHRNGTPHRTSRLSVLGQDADTLMSDTSTPIGEISKWGANTVGTTNARSSWSQSHDPQLSFRAW